MGNLYFWIFFYSASNLDNIQPPTLMEEMDNSILSIASIASEVAGMEEEEEENVEVVKDQEEAAATSDAPVTAPQGSVANDDMALEDIAPPTLMEEVRNITRPWETLVHCIYRLRMTVPHIHSASILTFTENLLN